MIIDPYRLLDPSYIPWSNVVGLYHMEVAGGNASYMHDSSLSVYTVSSQNGDMTRSTAQKKFGSYSLYNPNTPFSCLQFHFDTPNFVFAGDFCIECWIYPTAWEGTSIPLITYRLNTASYAPYLIYLTDAGAIRCRTSFNGTSWGVDITSANSIVALNQWTHLAYQRRGNEFSIYANGNRVASTTASGTLMTPNSYMWWGVESQTGNYYTPKYVGYIDEVRFCKQAVYDGTTYTVPTSAFPNG